MHLPVCVLLCILRFSDLAKTFSHPWKGHGKGFSPVCTLTWLVSLYLALKGFLSLEQFSQWQTYSECSGPPTCSSVTWVTSSYMVPKLLAHGGLPVPSWPSLHLHTSSCFGFCLEHLRKHHPLLAAWPYSEAYRTPETGWLAAGCWPWGHWPTARKGAFVREDPLEDPTSFGCWYLGLRLTSHGPALDTCWKTRGSCHPYSCGGHGTFQYCHVGLVSEPADQLLVACLLLTDLSQWWCP